MTSHVQENQGATVDQSPLSLGFFHIPKTAGLFLGANIQESLQIPKISIHKVFGNDHDNSRLSEMPIIGNQYLHLSEAGWTDIVLRSYPFYAGHLSIVELLALWRKDIFTYLSDPIKRALSLYRYGVTHSQSENAFLDWMNAFHLSIPKQFYGDQKLQKFNYETFADDFFTRISHVYATNNPQDVLAFLARDFGIKFNQELTNKPINAFIEVLPVEKITIDQKTLFELLHDVTWVDRLLIQTVEKKYPNNYLPTKTDYSYEEFGVLLKKYDYIELI
jgi:hypothetical protein